ncbi:MAG: hypothetical protein WCN98_03625 [Verrucomicrobiaceae bacterium]
MSEISGIQHGLSPAEQLEMVSADPGSIAKIGSATPAAQLMAMASRVDLYWKISDPCDEAAVEYLKKRPYEVSRFKDLSDEVKAQVLTAKPDLIHGWIKQGYLRSPAEPDGFHEAIVREMLIKLVHRNAPRVVQKTINGMRSIGYQWPEFLAMEKSIRSTLEREERIGQARQGT